MRRGRSGSTAGEWVRTRIRHWDSGDELRYGRPNDGSVSEAKLGTASGRGRGLVVIVIAASVVLIGELPLLCVGGFGVSVVPDRRGGIRWRRLT